MKQVWLRLWMIAAVLSWSCGSTRTGTPLTVDLDFIAKPAKPLPDVLEAKLCIESVVFHSVIPDQDQIATLPNGGLLILLPKSGSVTLIKELGNLYHGIFDEVELKLGDRCTEGKTTIINKFGTYEIPASFGGIKFPYDVPFILTEEEKNIVPVEVTDLLERMNQLYNARAPSDVINPMVKPIINPPASF